MINAFVARVKRGKKVNLLMGLAVGAAMLGLGG